MPFRSKNLSVALVSLKEQWQRATLSSLGIMVGTVAIILLVSIASGVQEDVTSQVEEIGINVLIVIPGRIGSGMFNPNLGGASHLKEEDAGKLAKVEGVVRTAPLTFVGGGVRSGENEASSILVATTPAWFEMHNARLREGRLIGPEDAKQNVTVIGSIAARELFGKAGSALGESVTINGKPFEVIGVTQDRESEQSLFSMTSLQNVVYLPYHYQKGVQPNLQTDRIMIQIRPDVEPKLLIERLDAILAQRLDHQQFQVLTQEDLLGLVYRLMGILTWLLTGLTSIALFVGGVGIMTVMLMSVNERAKEIGIRKTVGATNRDVFQQFLGESIVVGLMGGVVGLAFSYGVCQALYYFTPVKPLITPGIIALGIGVSVVVGAVFGVIPAMNAARKDPVVSLRYD